MNWSKYTRLKSDLDGEDTSNRECWDRRSRPMADRRVVRTPHRLNVASAAVAAVVPFRSQPIPESAAANRPSGERSSADRHHVSGEIRRGGGRQ
ncbi:uncharacterized protein HfgLR_08765 [Haloferax gibbonsii]|uniref:Uncharacterized protein n=1 Tax=Haloferax gibbonsii TaxID=35746 RepID=A0A871BGM3_HALGI|nr:uncharacterized protein HfgLR_08765 [Haloferax gibbonsii]